MEKEAQREKLVSLLSAAGLSGKFAEPGDPLFVRIWVRDGFRCVYCGEYLLGDRIRMTSAQLDHLLPKSKYGEYVTLPANLVLTCFCCNQLKREFDPLQELHEETRAKITPETFDDYRDRLIEKCQKYLKPLLEKKDAIWERSILIIRKELGG